MPELFTRDELERHMREEVLDAGGAKKWLRKHKLSARYGHIDHMITDGRAAGMDGIIEILGFKKVERFEPIAGKR